MHRRTAREERFRSGVPDALIRARDDDVRADEGRFGQLWKLFRRERGREIMRVPFRGEHEVAIQRPEAKHRERRCGGRASIANV